VFCSKNVNTNWTCVGFVMRICKAIHWIFWGTFIVFFLSYMCTEYSCGQIKFFHYIFWHHGEMNACCWLAENYHYNWCNRWQCTGIANLQLNTVNGL
jgi:hypothetical protein